MNQTSPRRVLLLSDKPPDSELVRAWLNPERGGDFVLVGTARPEAAFGQLDLSNITAIVIDISTLDGKVFPLLNALWAQAGGRPIIALSDNEQIGFVAEVLNAGARRYLPRRLLTEELLISTLRDSLEGRQRAERIARAEEFYLTLFEDFPALVWRSRVDGKCDYFNRAWLDFTGHSPEEELGTGWGQSLHPDDVGLCLQTYAEAFPTLQPYEAEYRLRRHDGEYRWMLDQARPYYSPQGEFAGYIGVCFDITERKRAEQARQESENYLSKVLDSISAGVLLIDETNHTIADANTAALRLMGASKTEVIGKLCHLFVCPAEQRRCPISDLKQEVDHSERVLLTAKGDKIPILKTVTPLVLKGRRYLLESFLDITGTKRVEQALLYRLSLEELVSSISTSFIKLSPEEIDGGVNDTLQAIGAFIGVDRAYVFRLSDDGATVSNTHEWCARGVKSLRADRQGLPIEAAPWFGEKLRRFEPIHIPRVAELPPGAEAEKSRFMSQGIQSMVGVPMVYGSSLVGYLGFDTMGSEKSWAEEDIALLKTIGEALVNALERKRAEAALQFEREQQLSIFNSIDEVIYVSDPLTHEILYVNAAFRRALKKDPTGGKCYKEFQGFDQPCEFCTNEIILNNQGQTHKWEYHNPLIDRDYEIFDRIIKWPDGREVRLEFALDITDRKKAEQGLLEEKLFSDTVTESMPGIFYVLDENARFARWNPALEKIVGYSTDEFAEFGALDIIAEEDRELIAEKIGEVFAKGSAAAEARLLTKTGDKIPYSLTGKSMVVGGKPYLVGMGIDITERKQAETAQQEQTRFLQTLIDAIPAPVFYKDTEGRYLGCNQAFENLLGKSREEIIGRTVFDITPSARSEIYHEKDLELLREGGRQSYEASVVHADGSPREVVFNKAIFQNADGSLGGMIGAILDITKRKAAEQALTRSAKEWQLTFAAVPDLIMVLDEQHRIVRANRAMEQVAGLKEAELIGRHCYEIVHGASAPPHFCPHCRLLADGQSHQEEVTEPRLGAILEVSVSPLRNDAGRVIGSVHIARDITGRKQAEKVIREREQQNKAILDNIPDIAWLKDKESRLLAVNEAFARNSGVEAETMVGKTDLDFYPPEIAEAYRADDREIMRLGRQKRIEEPITDGEGKIHWIETIKKPVFDENGEVIGTAGIARDITDRKQAEELIKESESRFRSLFEHNPVPYQSLDEAGRFLDVNEPLCQLLGYRDEELIGKSFGDFWTEGSKSQFVKLFDDFTKLGAVDQAELTLLTKPGKSRTVLLTGRVQREPHTGKFLRTHCILYDITERKRAEEQIRASLENFSHALTETVNALAATVETRDPYTAGHQRRVARVAVAVARRMGLAESRIEGLRVAAAVHDIGKISSPVEILNKPGILTVVEMGIIREHPKTSYEILKKIPFPWPVAMIALQHHERINGSGYPAGLKEEEILLEAKIIAVADVVEAMSTHRPFRPKRALEESRQEILQGKGTLYDPAAVEACLQLFESGELVDILEEKTPSPQ